MPNRSEMWYVVGKMGEQVHRHKNRLKPVEKRVDIFRCKLLQTSANYADAERAKIRESLEKENVVSDG